MVKNRIKQVVNGYGPLIRKLALGSLLTVLGFMAAFVFNKAVDADEQVKLLKKDVQKNEETIHQRKQDVDNCVEEMKGDIKDIKDDVADMREKTANIEGMLKVLIKDKKEKGD